jgi:hypothetical protein
MRKLLLALALSALIPSAQAQGPMVGPGALLVCTKIAFMAVGPTSITQLVAPVPGQAVSVCGWHITNTGATGTFAFQIGTGSNCGTGTVTIVPAMNVTSTAPSVDHIEYATSTLPISQGLCVTPSVATISVVVYYTQF